MEDCKLINPRPKTRKAFPDNGKIMQHIEMCVLFFYEVIKHRTPSGRFRVTANKIKKDGLFHGEPLLFTYQARVVFAARTGSGLLPNDDEGHLKYPNFFVIDIST